MVSSAERKYVSRYSQPVFALQVYVLGVQAPADGLPGASLYVEGAPSALHGLVVTPGSTPGLYEARLSSVDTSVVGNFEVHWSYQTSGVAQVYSQSFEVGASSPSYDALGQDWADVVDQVWAMFADLYDSPFGGPNLQVYVQTHFGRDRIAQLMRNAVDLLNQTTAPHQTYEFNGSGFPFGSWGGLLRQALYVEVLRHLVRSYVEQPEVVLANSISRVDRRDYMNRWQDVLGGEERVLATALSRYKQANMGLGNVSVLVSGGAYGDQGPYANPGGAGEAAARGYFAVGRYH